MNSYCTLSDVNYLDRGLALYDSLYKREDRTPFALHYLCLDDETYKRLLQLDLPFLFVYRVEDLEENEDLKEAKGNRDRKDYIFTLASYFSDYLLNSLEFDSIFYMDSDIYFYDDPQTVIDCCEGKDCGIMLHRHNFVGHRDGGFNVGVVWFKKSEKGREILSWWKNAVLKKEPKELSIMGDQKYLEAFTPMFGEDCVKVIDDDIGHGAPWNFRLYVYDDFKEKGLIGWGDKKQKLVFNHFSQFWYNPDEKQISFDNNVYAHLTYNGAVFMTPEVYGMYEDYYSALVEVKKKWL
tara:strand:+ start:6761 stop:7642 length:882 start_codon:yes stop_codon:yes gene_type:complete